jgi:poly(hydroxyalkanoate) granule-associated protein
MAKRKTVSKSARGMAAGTQERMLHTVHQIWLAGLGAAAKAQKGAPKLLEELVAEGARVNARASKATSAAVRGAMSDAQTAIRDSVAEVRERASDALDGLEKAFQARVHRALKQLGVPSAEQIAALSRRVDALNANIGKLGRRRPTATRAHGDGSRKIVARHQAAAT